MIEPEADIFSDWQTVDTHTKSFKDYVDAEDFDDTTSTQITFNIKQDDFFFIMPNLELDMTLQLCDKDGEPLPNEVAVAPVNWLCTALFSDLKMKLGNEYIEGGDANYWLKSYFLLTYFSSDSAKKGLQKEMGIYSKDTAGLFDSYVIKTEGNNFANQGFVWRWKKIKNKKSVGVRFRLPTNLSYAQKTIPSGVPLTLTLTRNDPGLYINFTRSATLDYVRIKIEKPRLYFRKRRYKPMIVEDMKREFALGNYAKYPFLRPELLGPFQIRKDSPYESVDIIKSGQVPLAMFLFFNRSEKDMYEINTYVFENMNINNIQCKVGNAEGYPYKAYTPEFDREVPSNNKVIEMYNCMNEIFGQLKNYESFNDVEYSDFKREMICYPFMFANESIGGNYREPMPEAPLSVHINFKTPVVQRANMFALAIFQSTFYIGQGGQVRTSYTPGTAIDNIVLTNIK